MKKFIASAKRFLSVRNKNETGLVKGTGRKFTDWSTHLEKNHSVMWLIEHAVTEEMLTDVLRFANYQTNASADTRRAWANAAEKQIFVLKRRPPTYGKVEFEEFREMFNRLEKDPMLRIPEGTGFKEVRQRELMALPASSLPRRGEDFLAVRAEGPTCAPMSGEIQALIDSVEVPRPDYDPDFRLRMIQKGQLATYTDGKRYCHDFSKTVTEMRICGRRLNCPPQPVIGLDYVAPAPEDCTFNEWDVKFFCHDKNITKEVVSESHPDCMRQSRVNPRCALFFGDIHDGVVPMKWVIQMRDLFYSNITVSIEDVPVLAAEPDRMDTIAKRIAALDDPPMPI